MGKQCGSSSKSNPKFQSDANECIPTTDQVIHPELVFVGGNCPPNRFPLIVMLDKQSLIDQFTKEENDGSSAQGIVVHADSTKDSPSMVRPPIYETPVHSLAIPEPKEVILDRILARHQQITKLSQENLQDFKVLVRFYPNEYGIGGITQFQSNGKQQSEANQPPQEFPVSSNKPDDSANNVDDNIEVQPVIFSGDKDGAKNMRILNEHPPFIGDEIHSTAKSTPIQQKLETLNVQMVEECDEMVATFTQKRPNDLRLRENKRKGHPREEHRQSKKVKIYEIEDVSSDEEPSQKHVEQIQRPSHPLKSPFVSSIVSRYGQSSPEQICIGHYVFGQKAYRVEKIVNLHGCTLERQQLMSLDKRAWVGSSVVDLLSRDINARQFKDTTKVRRYCFGTYLLNVFGTLKKPKTLTMEHLKKVWLSMFDELNYRLDPTQSDMFICPVVAKDHWRIVVLNVKEKTVDYLDSDNQPMDDIADLIHKLKIATAAVLGSSEVLHYPCNPRVVPQQVDRQNCGIMAMKFMEYWDGKLLSTIDPEMCNYYRTQYVHHFVMHPDNEVRQEIWEHAKSLYATDS